MFLPQPTLNHDDKSHQNSLNSLSLSDTQSKQSSSLATIKSLELEYEQLENEQAEHKNELKLFNLRLKEIKTQDAFFTSKKKRIKQEIQKFKDEEAKNIKA